MSAMLYVPPSRPASHSLSFRRASRTPYSRFVSSMYPGEDEDEDADAGASVSNLYGLGPRAHARFFAYGMSSGAALTKWPATMQQ